MSDEELTELISRWPTFDDVHGCMDCRKLFCVRNGHCPFCQSAAIINLAVVLERPSGDEEGEEMMPRVHGVKRARKSIRGTDIKKGDSYYWWKFRFGGKQVSKTYPRPQQLTRSDFAIQCYDIQDRLSDLNADSYIDDPSSLKSDLDDIASDIRALGDEQDEKFNNMPEGLQQGDTGQLLEERRDACESWADEIEAIEVDEPERQGGEEDEAFAARVREALETAIQEAQQATAP